MYSSDNDNSGSDTDLEYKKCYGTSKRASRNVQGWLERKAGWPLKTSKVSDFEGLAKDLVVKGVQMPDNILDDLKKTIECRTELNEIHKSRGNCDHQHVFALKAFQKVLSTFCPPPPPPSPPTTPPPQISKGRQVTPVRFGNPSYTFRHLSSKPEYMEEDPMWK